jgi:hypothetical protein
MFNHEHFRELTALERIGQVSPEENRELAEHQRECAECRRLKEEYSLIIFQDLPQVEESRWCNNARVQQSASDKGLRDRFLARAQAEGIDFPLSVEKPQVVETRQWRRVWQWKLVVAVSVLVAMTLVGFSLGIKIWHPADVHIAPLHQR